MGTIGLVPPWEARIPKVDSEPETRVEPAENLDSALTTELIAQGDVALAMRCQSGDLHAYERLYALHGRRMKNLARNLLGNASDAEDAVQETFLKIQRSIGGFRGQSSFATWIFRIL